MATVINTPSSTYFDAISTSTSSMTATQSISRRQLNQDGSAHVEDNESSPHNHDDTSNGSGHSSQYGSSSSNNSNSKINIIKNVIRYFDLSWFAVTMSWGGASLAVAGFPVSNDTAVSVFQYIGLVIWIWNMLYWILFVSLFSMRIIMYPKEVWRMMKTPRLNFISCCSMSLAIIGIGFLELGFKIMTRETVKTVGFWVYNCNWVFVLLCAIIPIWYMSTRQDLSYSSMPALFLLPMVASLVNSSLGSKLGVYYQKDEEISQWLLFSALCQWGFGFLTAYSLVGIYLLRLIFHSFPTSDAGNTVWIVVGVFGQGCNTMLNLGDNALEMNLMGYFCLGDASCKERPTLYSVFGNVFPGFSVIIGLFLWACGFFWIAAATWASLYHINKVWWFRTRVLREKNVRERHMPFNLGWWSGLFPFITELLATYLIYKETGLGFYLWLGRIWCVMIMIMVFYVHIKTARRVLDGSIWQLFQPK